MFKITQKPLAASKMAAFVVVSHVVVQHLSRGTVFIIVTLTDRLLTEIKRRVQLIVLINTNNTNDHKSF